MFLVKISRCSPDSFPLGGLQSTSTAVGDTIAENTDLRPSKSKQTDEASASLCKFGKGIR